MKKIIVLMLIIITICFISSCNKSEDTDTFVQAEDDYFLYNLNGMAFSYDIDDNGNIYYITSNNQSNTDSNATGEASQSLMFTSLLKVLNTDGALLNTYMIPGLANNICIDGAKIYYIECLASNELALSEFFPDTQSSQKICDLNPYSRMDNLIVIDGILYYIGINDQLADKEFSYYQDDYFKYSGERLGFIDLSAGTMEELPVELPITFSKTLDGNLMIYAYDEKGGYYFTEYDTKGKSFKEKVYHDMEQFLIFRIFNENNDYLYAKTKTNSLTLTTGTIADKNEEVELVPDFKSSADIQYKAGFTYSQSFDRQHIVRIRNASYFRGNEKISMLSPDYYDIYAPFGCGYTIKHEYKTDEEMALSILSQDNSFDLFLMDSNQEISSNIRDKGSFYPLNDVKGVKDYLDACFPYIKNSAADADGNIWMLPIAVNIPCLFYNENKCREYGIEFSNSMNLDNLIQIITKVKQDSQAEQLYYFENKDFIDSLMYQYTRTYNEFNNQLFRDLAGTSKADFNYIAHPLYGNDMMLFNLSINKDNNFLFFYNNDHEYQFNMTDIDSIRACELPSITDNQTNTANCIYLCVNPASKNLKTTLQYISSICSYLLTLDNNLMLSDRNIYKDSKLVDDLYAIYANGDIQFTYPNELFINDFEKYLTDEKDLESVIKDSNRRLEIFLNE